MKVGEAEAVTVAFSFLSRLSMSPMHYTNPRLVDLNTLPTSTYGHHVLPTYVLALYMIDIM